MIAPYLTVAAGAVACAHLFGWVRVLVRPGPGRRAAAWSAAAGAVGAAAVAWHFSGMWAAENGSPNLRQRYGDDLAAAVLLSGFGLLTAAQALQTIALFTAWRAADDAGAGDPAAGGR